MPKKPEKPYRKNVGIVVFNSKGHVLMGNRMDNRSSWQFPQGGLDEKEDPLTAAKRELLEEVGIDNAMLVYEVPNWLSYDFPPNIDAPHMKDFRGQTQKWFLMYWDNTPDKCKLDSHEREFEMVKFYPLKNSANTIVEFKKDIYKQLITILSPQIERFLDNSKKEKL